jgi:hypothetical protein
MTLTVRSASVTGATTAARALTHAEMDANWAHVIESSNQNFTPSGSGAVATDLQTRARYEVYFKDYGATQDGSTDDSDAVQAAITYAKSQKVQALYGSDVLLKGNGVILISEQIDLSGCNIDLQGGRFKLAASFSTSPAILLQEGAANAGASRVVRFAVDGNRDNQSSSTLTAVELDDANWIDSDIRLGFYDCKYGLRVTGNTENQVIHVAGYKCDVLVAEVPDGASTPDENVYYISANTCKQFYVQETADQATSAIVHFNCEAQETGATDFPVVAKTNKHIALYGMLRSMINGGVHIDCAASTQVVMDMFVYGSSGDSPLKVTECGSLNGRMTVSTSTSGGAEILDVNVGGDFAFTIDTLSGGPAMTLGESATSTSRPQQMNIVLSPQGITDSSLDLQLHRAQDCTITLTNAEKGVDVSTAAVGVLLNLPAEILLSDLPVTLGGATAGQLAGMHFSCARNLSELASYSTPLNGMLVWSARDFGNVPVVYSSVASAWLPMETNSVSGDKGDSAATLTPGLSHKTNVWATTLAADRAVTLSTTAARSGSKFRIVRTADGAFNLNVGTGPLAALVEDEWCDVEYNGSAWILTAKGSLA